MYIFDCIYKLFHPKKTDDDFDYNPLEQKTESTDDYERCSHEFMPVDSTGEVLACIKCGFIVKRNSDEGYNKNE